MATALRMSFRFFFDANLWCQVSRTLLQYFQRYRLFSIFHFFVANRMTSSLHNRKMSISLKRKKIFQKEKRHSSVFWKTFQISTKKFSFHRHFKKFSKQGPTKLNGQELVVSVMGSWLYTKGAIDLWKGGNLECLSNAICTAGGGKHTPKKISTATGLP